MVLACLASRLETFSTNHPSSAVKSYGLLHTPGSTCTFDGEAITGDNRHHRGALGDPGAKSRPPNLRHSQRVFAKRPDDVAYGVLSGVSRVVLHNQSKLVIDVGRTAQYARNWES